MLERGWWETQVRGLIEQARLRSVDMHTMRGNCAWAQYAMIVQPLDDAHLGFCEAIVLILLVLCHVNVKGSLRRCSRSTGLQCAAGECEARVQAKHGRQARPRVHFEAAHKSQVLLDASVRRRGAIPVGHFVAQNAAHAGLFDRASNHVERAVHKASRGVMIEERGRALPDCIRHRQQGAHTDVLFREGGVQRPPRALKDLRKVAGCRRGDSQPTREERIEMSVSANGPRHQQLPRGVEFLSFGVRCFQFPRRADVLDAAPGNQDCLLRHHLVWSLCSHQGGICDQHQLSPYLAGSGSFSPDAPISQRTWKTASRSSASSPNMASYRSFTTDFRGHCLQVVDRGKPFVAMGTLKRRQKDRSCRRSR